MQLDGACHLPILWAERSADIHKLKPEGQCLLKTKWVLVICQSYPVPKNVSCAKRDHSSHGSPSTAGWGCREQRLGSGFATRGKSISLSGPHFLHLGKNYSQHSLNQRKIKRKIMSCINKSFLEMKGTTTFLIFHHQKVTFLCEISRLGQMTWLTWSVSSSRIT